MSNGTAPNDIELVVKDQLDAYNDRDIDTFMACWAEDAQIFEHPSKLLASGTKEIRERHLIRFQEPNLFGRLVHRAVVGNKVIDQEVVTRTFPEGTGQIDVICIYEVAERKIKTAWFIMGEKVLDAEP